MNGQHNGDLKLKLPYLAEVTKVVLATPAAQVSVEK